MKIPAYEVSGETIQPTAVDPNVAGQGGRAMEKMGEGIVSLAEDWKKLKDRDDQAKAQIALTQKIDQIHIKSAQDPDVWGASARAQQEIDAALQETAKMVSSPDAKEAYMQKAGLVAERKWMAINTQLMARQSQQGKADDLNLMDLKGQDWLNAVEGKDKVVIEKEINDIANDSITSRHSNPVAMRSHLRSFWRDLYNKQIDHDINLNLATDNPVDRMKVAQDELAKGDKGRYSYLDAGQRIIAEKKLQTGMKTAETTEKERARNINHQTDKDLTWKYLHGGLTQDDIDRNYNRLTPGRAATLTKGLIMGDVPQKSNPKAYGDMMDFIADKKNSERDCTDKLLEMETAGKLSKDEAQTLAESFIVDPGKDPVMQLSQRPNLPEMLKAQDQKNDMSQQKRSWLSSAWQMIGSYVGSNAAKGAELALQMNVWMGKNNSQSDEDMPKAAKEVIKKDIQVTHPEVNMLDDIPNSVMSAKEGVSNLLSAPSKNKADYIIQNGKVTPTKTKKERNVGDTVMYKGSERKIKKILPDGKIELED